MLVVQSFVHQPLRNHVFFDIDSICSSRVSRFGDAQKAHLRTPPSLLFLFCSMLSERHFVAHPPGTWGELAVALGHLCCICANEPTQQHLQCTNIILCIMSYAFVHVCSLVGVREVEVQKCASRVDFCVTSLSGRAKC